MTYQKNRMFTKNNLALFSLCEKIGLKVSARQRMMGDGKYRQCLEVFYPKNNEYIALSEKIDNDELGDAIFKAYLKYYSFLAKYGTIKHEEPEIAESVIKQIEKAPVNTIDRDHKCKYIKRKGESCTLNNNCKYPNCDKNGPKEQSMKFKF